MTDAVRYAALKGFQSGSPVLAGRWSLARDELRERSDKARALLMQSGLRPGDRVAICLEDEAEVAVLFIACLDAGLPLVLLDPGAGAAQVRSTLSAADVRAAVVERQLAERWGLAPEPGQHLWLAAPRPQRRLVDRLLGRRQPGRADTYPALTDALDGAAGLSEHAPASEALVLSTSGTTGLPKLARLTHGNLLQQAELLRDRLGFGAAARVLYVAPLSHVDGIHGLHAAACNGFTLVRPGPFSIPSIPSLLDDIYRHQVSHLFINPTLMRLILEFGSDLSVVFADVELVTSSTAPLSVRLWESFEDATGVRVSDAWGMTEIGNATLSGPDDQSRKVGSIGCATDCEISVRDEHGAEVADGCRGELFVRGRSVFAGYVGEPERTPGAWFATGDLAVRSAAGHLQLVGRRNSVIIVGGRNVLPGEVDLALEAHPEVRAAATIGLADPIWGERVVSFVEADASRVDDAALIAHLEGRLADYQIPRIIRVLDSLPRGRSGKVPRDALEALVVRDEEDTSLDVTAGVLDVAASIFREPRDALGMDTTPDSCRGWDSMAHLDFVQRLEHTFGVSLAAEDILAIRSLADAVDRVRSKLDAAV